MAEKQSGQPPQTGAVLIVTNTGFTYTTGPRLGVNIGCVCRHAMPENDPVAVPLLC